MSANNMSFPQHQASYSEPYEDPVPPKAITALLPVFQEHANTLAMIHHATLLIQKETEYLNPGQTPVMTADQPLFALAKEIPWLNHDLLGEDKFLFMMGDLHTEMNFMACLGISEIYLLPLFHKVVLFVTKANIIYSCKNSK